ncbi:DMT family transporter [Rhodoferax sp. PAMC 29310]|uniref:DMT family transporter n=1 Tax=Rhodoferax sp. PAMC 29310 TaxID=2822760 RepID=UPI001B3211E7|nr:DMT family transporter [Rhodoferax sp. PAMC 29310]
MQARLTPTAALLLSIPPLMWAGNAVVGRLISEMVSPMTLNLLRWALAFAILLPLAGNVLRRDSLLWPNWRRFAMLGLLSVGAYNALLYLALNTSAPINVTLVGSSTPIWMLLIGRLFYGVKVSRRQLVGAAMSIIGVLLVLSRGELQVLQQVRLVPGDVYVLMASAAWATYSWMLARPTTEPASLRQNWSAFLLGQIAFGLVWSALSSGGEWALGKGHFQWSWPLGAALVFIAVGPAVIAYRAWGAGVGRAGPAAAGFFINLTPLFTALLSTVFLGETPQTYHVLAFIMIAGGIVVSSRR